MDTLGSTRTDAEPYMMRPDENTFRAVDYSRLNEKRHNWKKIDTFQTPTGHVGVHNRTGAASCRFLREASISPCLRERHMSRRPTSR